MKVISFLNSKGGVGKTTLCINVARYLQIHKKISNNNICQNRVLIIDSDPQASVRDWHNARDSVWANYDDIHVLAADSPASLKQIKKTLKSSDYDYVLVDTPGKIGDLMASAITISDMCLLPIQPSPYDLWAAEETAELIKTRQQITEGQPAAYYVLNRCINNANILSDVFKHLNENDFPLLDSCVYQRVIYAQSAKLGQTVFESVNSSAKSEIIMLTNQIIKKLDDL